MVLLYGPGWKTLFTASILGAVMCTPVAYGLTKMSAFITIPGATYVLVVCSAPAAVLMFGPKMSVILIGSILGGIIGNYLRKVSLQWGGGF